MKETINGMKKTIETLQQNQSIIEAIKNIKVEIANEEQGNKQSYESEIKRKMDEDLSDSDQEFHGFIDSETNSYHPNGSDIDPFEQSINELEMKQLLMERRLTKMITPTIHIPKKVFHNFAPNLC